MPKLNQIIAIQAGRKSQAKEVLTAAYHQLQKLDLLSGISRTYKPKDETGEAQPAESKLVQLKVGEVVDRVTREMTELFDVVATQDFANCQARADIKIDGRTLVAGVPVTNLLFLEKQLIDMQTFIEKLPVLDPGERWVFDAAQDCYASESFQTTKTKKVPKSHIKYEATKEHPAQVEMYFEDVTVGTWTTVKFSGEIPANEKNQLLERVRGLSDAVKQAREEANGAEVEKKKTGEAILGYIFRGK
ncbi:MAG: hypothetical protein JWM11_7896 [Planctomycetaceae bacterium]|nr:hypothetical protein [Planctomycetaceae bacterium]